MPVDHRRVGQLIVEQHVKHSARVEGKAMSSTRSDQAIDLGHLAIDLDGAIGDRQVDGLPTQGPNVPGNRQGQVWWRRRRRSAEFCDL